MLNRKRTRPSGYNTAISHPPIPQSTVAETTQSVTAPEVPKPVTDSVESTPKDKLYELTQYIFNEGVTDYLTVCKEALSMGLYQEVKEHADHYWYMCQANKMHEME